MRSPRPSSQVDLVNLSQAIVENLSPDLLSPTFARSAMAKTNPLFGHCYIASEALYHMAGGKKSGLRPCRLKMPDNQWHWWLVDSDQRIIDLTAGQFERRPQYELGVRAAFLSKRPSARARKLMARILAAMLREHPESQHRLA